MPKPDNRSGSARHALVRTTPITFRLPAAGDLLGSWTLTEIHGREVGDLLHNLDFVDDLILNDNFGVVTVNGEDRNVAIGDGNTVEIVSSLGNEGVEVGDGWLEPQIRKVKRKSSLYRYSRLRPYRPGAGHCYDEKS